MKASDRLKEAVLKRTAEIKEDGYHQVILNIMYEHWQDNKALSYKDVTQWYKDEYGALAQFAVLVGKYNQQVTNGGHIQYYQNGYVDGEGGYANAHDSDIPLHQTLQMLFRESGLDDDMSMKVFKIIKEFYIEVDTEEIIEQDGYDEDEEYFLEMVKNEDYLEVSNTDILSALDSAYFEISDEFMEILEQWFKKKITEGE